MSFGDIDQSLDCQWYIRLEVHSVLVAVTREHEFIKLLIFFFSDFFLFSSPDGFNEIKSLTINSDGEVDKVRIFVDNMLNA
jgi:hypothetical protein